MSTANNKLYDRLIELRWHVTTDLDGRQLQYRYRLSTISPYEYSQWEPVPIVWEHKRAEA